MTEQEIKAAFAGFDQGHPFYLAVLALLDSAVSEEQGAVTPPNLGDGARHFNAGRLAHALDFRTAFGAIMGEALAEVAAEVRRREIAAKRQNSDE